MNQRVDDKMLRWIRRWWKDLPMSEWLRTSIATSLPGSYCPRVGVLEPRIVLNASAELNVLGQLVIMGDSANDVVNVNVVNDSQLQLRDDAGDIIPISGHNGGPTGSELDPIEISSIASGQLQVDLGDGNDLLMLELPDSLDITVIDGSGIDGAGDDRVKVIGQASAATSTFNQLHIEADQIEIASDGGILQLADRDVFLSGNVTLGETDALVQVELGNGSLLVSGALNLAGDVTFRGADANIDLSQTTLSSTTANSNLTFELSLPGASSIELGTADESAGHELVDLEITSTASFHTDSTIQIDGAFSVLASDQITISNDITAGSINIETAGTLSIDAPLTSTSQAIELSSGTEILLNQSIDTSAAGADGEIRIDAPEIRMTDVALATTGADVEIVGEVVVDESVSLSVVAIPGDGPTQIDFRGTIQGTNDPTDRIILDAVQSNVTFHAPVGRSVTAATINGLEMDARHVTLGDVVITSGDLDVQASRTTIDASTVTVAGTGTARFGGSVIISSDQLISRFAETVRFEGPIGSFGSDWALFAGTGVEILGNVTGLGELAINTGGTLQSDALILVDNDLTILAARGIEIAGGAMVVGEDLIWLSDVRFSSSTTISSDRLRFDGDLSVSDSRVVRLDSTVIDSPSQNSWQKRGSGTLILEGDQDFRKQSIVAEGTLVLGGVYGPSQGFVVEQGGTLSGSAIVHSTLRGEGGAIAPSPTDASSMGAGLEFSSIDLSADSTLEIDALGTDPGQTQDVLISDGSISINNALLSLRPASLAPDSEIVVIQNDAPTDVFGRFRISTDPDGRQLAQPRVLEDGAIVSRNFGEPGQSAYITYFGGDGNDVTIVTAGDGLESILPVTLVERNGVNLEIRTGTDMADANAATPSIRPVAGLNGNAMRLIGNGPRNEVHFDIDDFVDPTGELNVDIDFVVSLQSQSELDRIVVFDSVASTPDTPESILQTQRSAQQTFVSFEQPDANRPTYSINAIAVEQFDYQVAAETFQLRTTAADDVLTITAGDTSGRTNIQNVTGDSTSITTLTHPTQLLSIFAGAGDDQIVLESFDVDFRSGLSVLGESGQDSIQLLDDLNVGLTNIAANVRLDAETLDVASSISTARGNFDGQIQLLGGQMVTITGTLDAGDSSILIDGNGGQIDATLGDLAARDITMIDAVEVLLGDTQTLAGRLSLGTLQNPIATAVQFNDTSVVTESLAGNVTGDIILDQLSNDFVSIDGLVVGGDLEIFDSVGDLRLAGIETIDSTATIVSAGNLNLANRAIDATGGTIDLIAATGIAGDQTSDSVPDLLAAQIDLTVGSAFPGMPTGGPAGSGIGVPNAVDLIASVVVNADTATTNGDLRLSSPSATLPVGIINAGTGRVELSGGSIEDADDDSIADILAGEVVLSGSDGIGQLHRLELQSIPLIHASTVSGDIDLFIDATSETTLQNISTQLGDITIDQTGQQPMVIRQFSSGGGIARVTNLDGSIEIGQPTQGDLFQSTGNGDVFVIAQGEQSDILVHSLMSSADGDVTLVADRDIRFAAESRIDSQDGAISVIAGRDQGTLLGSFVMDDGSSISAGVGSVDIVSAGDLFVASIASDSAAAAIDLTSKTGRIVDNGDTDVDLHAPVGTSTLNARLGIGNGDALETDFDVLFGTVTEDGSIEINERSDITLQELTTNNGRMQIVAEGSILATNVTSQNVSGLDGDLPNDNRDITLVTTDDTGDIRVDSVIAENGSDVLLRSSDDVLSVNTNSLLRADDLAIESNNATGDQNDAVRLIVSVNQLEAAVTGDRRGDLSIVESDTVMLAASDRNDDTETVSTSNGEIRISAQSIQIVDMQRVADDASLLSDREVFAGGENGRIRFTANQSLELGDNVQLHSDQSEIGSVNLSAPEIVLGQGFQIDTGNQVGVARIFAPRPDIEQLVIPINENNPLNTSFFDYRSVTVDRLQQESVNDATGLLSLDVGNEGERGLTINIDWGVPTERFQQIDGLSGDAPPLSVSHVYVEADILESRLNGRTSATAPLEVRFAVRHHESIVVVGDTIQQSASDVESVDGSLISSTDNPLTFESPAVQVLENGETRFIIPNLSIPVAFFPVRDVVPETEKAEIVISTNTIVTQNQSSFEIAETSVTTSTGREEYFQIRVLSPDPEGEDLVEPKRLPDDILGGRRLNDLFSQLPDGRYELQYVLGDGNVRSILQIDLRDGQPIIRGDELDGGAMRLRPWDGGEDDTETEPEESSAERDSVQLRPPNHETAWVEPDSHAEESAPSGLPDISSHYHTPMAALMSIKASQKLQAGARAESHPKVE